MIPDRGWRRGGDRGPRGGRLGQAPGPSPPGAVPVPPRPRPPTRAPPPGTSGCGCARAARAANHHPPPLTKHHPMSEQAEAAGQGAGAAGVCAVAVSILAMAGAENKGEGGTWRRQDGSRTRGHVPSLVSTRTFRVLRPCGRVTLPRCFSSAVLAPARPPPRCPAPNHQRQFFPGKCATRLYLMSFMISDSVMLGPGLGFGI